MTLHALLSQLIKDLKACPDIDVHAAKAGRANTGAAAKRAQKNWEFLAPLEVIQFSPPEPIFLRYTVEVDGFRPSGGEFRLVSVGSTLCNKRDNGLVWDGIPAEQLALVENLHIFDSHPESGDSMCAAFHVIPSEQKTGIPMPDLYFVDRGQTFKMAVDYGDYIRGLVGCAAVGGWQYLYLADPVEDQSRLESLREDLTCLKQVLPSRDWSSFEGRLERLGA